MPRESYFNREPVWKSALTIATSVCAFIKIVSLRIYVDWNRWCYYVYIAILYHLSLTFRDHLHFFVGQSLPSSSTVPVLYVFSHVSCQFLFIHIFSVVVDPSPSRLPPSSLLRYDHAHHFS